MMNQSARVVVLIFFAAAAVYLWSGCKPAGTPTAPAAVPVIAAEVVVRDQPIYQEFVGQTRGSRDVDLRARVEGFLDGVHFAEGMPVTNGALLYTMDDRPFRAALNQALGALAQAQSQWEKTQRDTNRLGPLWLKNAISRQQYDDALSAEQSAAAVYQSARALADSAEIQLGYTRIYSPMDGLVGKNEISAGNLVGRGESTLLTTISQVDPISVRFSVSEQQYLNWRRHTADENRERGSSKGLFELILADGSLHPHRGDVTFADRQVDERTGTLLLQVSFPNPEGIVRPGQFGRVRFPITVITNAILVPQRALSELQANYSVFVVEADGVAKFRMVTPGPRVGSFAVITDGLEPGEIIVVEGIQKLRNNVPVVPTMTNLVANLPQVTGIR
jgi:membrane fusion protein, multidrug efflux system